MLYQPLLPVGAHDATLEEINRICVEPFPLLLNRFEMWSKFILLPERIKQLHKPFILWIDGSFVTDKEYPSDIDVIIIMNIEDAYDAQQENAELYYEIFQNKEKMNKIYSAHILQCYNVSDDIEFNDDFFKSFEDQETQETHKNHKGYFRIDFGLNLS